MVKIMSQVSNQNNLSEEDISNQQLFRVQFRFILGQHHSYEMSRLFFVYKKPWSILMSKILSSRNTSIYDYLPELRKLIDKDLTVTDLVKYLDYFDLDEFQLLTDAQPLFNRSPKDLKCYIVAVLGLRPHHLTNYN